MDPSAYHHWLVLVGRIGIWIEGDTVAFEVDPEGANLCVLTAQDTAEVSSILTELARHLWARQEGPRADYPRYQQLDEGVVAWPVEAGPLRIVPLRTPPATVGIQLQGGVRTSLVPETVAEFVQFLQRIRDRSETGP